MDMTYFAIIPPDLKMRKLKVAIVFLHETFRFEVWLSGGNRQIQMDYSRLIREKGWNKYRLTANPKTSDSILEHTLIAEPDFGNLDDLTKEIESGTVNFMSDVQKFFHDHGDSGN